MKESTERILVHEDVFDRKENFKQALQGDLSFSGADTSYATHSLHAFAAKFPPPLPRLFIEKTTRPGEWVFDPMAGSGTALVEAMLLGCNAIGIDIDPLARIIAAAKTSRVSASTLKSAFQRVINHRVESRGDPENIESEFKKSFNEEELKFFDYWFSPSSRADLYVIKKAIEEEKDLIIKRILWTAFSSIIVTKSGGVSQAMDLAHSRPHKVSQPRNRDAWKLFCKRADKYIDIFEKLPETSAKIIIIAGDSKRLPLVDKSVDLIITSPPYANAIDYMRAHKFSLVWMGKRLAELRTRRASAIGSERRGDRTDELPSFVVSELSKIRQKDMRKAEIVEKYFVEMQDVLGEMTRVLKPQRGMVLVVGPSKIRGITVPTHLCIENIAMKFELEVVGILPRVIDRDRRLMPSRFQRNNESMIEQRMHEEYVLAFWKGG